MWIVLALAAGTIWVANLATWTERLGNELRSTEWSSVQEDELGWNPILMGNGRGSVWRADMDRHRR